MNREIECLEDIDKAIKAALKCGLSHFQIKECTLVKNLSIRQHEMPKDTRIGSIMKKVSPFPWFSEFIGSAPAIMDKNGNVVAIVVEFPEEGEPCYNQALILKGLKLIQEQLKKK